MRRQSLYWAYNQVCRRQSILQLSDDCFAHEGGQLPLDDALALIKSRLRPVAEVESVPIGEACGRILAEDLVAPIDVPPHDNSAVDGYAVFFGDLAAAGETPLPVGGRAAAGQGLGRPARRGEAVRIFTGASMPTGMDTVAMQEDCRLDGDSVVVPPGLRVGANRRRRGEDVCAGDRVLGAGRRLRAEDIGIAAALGQQQLVLRRRLRVGGCSTGNEVFNPGAERTKDGIFDANRYTLLSLLRGMGCAVTDLGILPDERDTVRRRLRSATGFDLVVTSGGASVGEEDHVAAVLPELGSVHFWKLAIKPGRPVLMGQIGGMPVIGLPGNPAAVMVTFLVVARRVVLRLAGAEDAVPVPFAARADFAHRKKKGRREFVRAQIARDSAGLPRVSKYQQEGAGNLMSFVASDGLVELAEDTVAVAPGDIVPFIPLEALR